jgi:hypothetical protein
MTGDDATSGPRRQQPAFGRGFRTLGDTVAAITAPIMKKRGFTAPAIAAEWPRVVGERLAVCCLPEKIVFPPRQRSHGVLHVRIATSALAPELQHVAPVIVERINSYFGFPAVARLHIRHAPLPALPNPPPSPPVSTAEAATGGGAEPLPPGLESVRSDCSDDLKRVLVELGRHLAGRRRTGTGGSGSAGPRA